MRTVILYVLLFVIGIALVRAIWERDQEPEIKNCPSQHTCRWVEVDITAGKCIKNCGGQVNW